MNSNYRQTSRLLFLLMVVLLPFYVSAQGDYVLYFDGSDDYVEIPDNASLDLTNGFTLEVWVHPTSNGASLSRVMSKTGGYGFGYDNDEVWFTTYGILDYKLSYSLPTNSWTHLAVVMDASNDAIFYVNGVNQGTATGSLPASTSSDPLYIGRGVSPLTQQVDGEVDEVRIWSDIRTQAEIQANMHKELEGNEANLVAYYQMSDGSGTSLTDNSQNSNTGTLTNGPVWTASRTPIQSFLALDFDGTDDYVEISYDADLNPSNFTLEAWAKVEGGSGNFRSVITSRSDLNTTGYVIYAGSDDQWQFWTGNNSGSLWDQLNSGIAVTSDWTHIACSFDGTTKRIYINGVLAASAAGTYFQNSTRPCRIGGGATESTPDYYFDGKIDEIRIWSDVRTQTEIQANMNKELVGNEANLATYYQMSNGSGTELTDNSTNNLTGTLINGALWKTSGAHAGANMALNFDGSEDHITVPDDNSLDFGTSDFSIEAWIKRDALGTRYDILNKKASDGNQDLGFFIGSDNLLYFFTRGTSVGETTQAESSASIGTDWTHVSCVRSGTTHSVYVNGKLEGSQTGTVRDLDNSQPMTIGRNTSGTNHFDGQIDEIRIWGDARTEAEIRAYKDRTLNGDESDLLSYYRFDQQDDAGNTTLYDITENGNDGTFTDTDATLVFSTSSAFNTWMGSEDSDWNNAQNWSSGSVPSTEDVGVFAWSGNNLPSSANISARNFYLDNGVTLNHSGNLTLSGDYYNAGTFTTSGNVSFSGSSAQTLRGTGSSTFGTLTINNSAGVSLEKDLTANTNLTLSNGILSLNGNTLSLGNGASVGGTANNSNHVNATTGNLTKGYSGTGSFQFPVGDGSVYSPISLNFTSGSFSSGNASVSLTSSKHPNNSSSTDFINRYWTVNSSGISSFNCSVTALYDDGDIESGATEADMVGGKWDGSSWTDLGSVTAGSNQITGTVSSFSDFTAGEPVAFPVELLNFTAKPEADIVVLDWTTSNEINSDYFSVERSSDDKQWTALGAVAAAGYSNQLESYQFIDRAPLLGKSYYRLKKIDQDGSYDYSPSVEVNFDELAISIYPNPVKEILTVDIQEDGEINVQMMDIHGKIVLRLHLIRGVNTISLTNLAPGVYTLQLKDQRGKRREFQVMK